MTQNKQLYELNSVWDQDMQLGQKNLIRALADFLPEDTNTILDVGCGSGKITQPLIAATGIPIIGLDSSAEALSRCTFETIHGDATALSFDDNTFDVVMTTDMLEHLPDEVEEKTWLELFRVASKTVMVTVPFREEMFDGMAQCEQCGSQYHVNWHMRSYDWPELVHRTPPGWQAVCVVLSGEPWSPYHPLETRFRRELLDEWSGWNKTLCPHCGTPGQPPAAPATLPVLTASALGKLIYTDVLQQGVARMHSEILVVYRRTDNEQWVPGKALPCALSVPQNAGVAPICSTKLEENLLPYPLTGRAVTALEGGIVVQLPSYHNSDTLHIHWREGVNTPITLTVEDGLGLVFSAELSPLNAGETIVQFPRIVVPGYYGIIVRMAVTDAIATITSAPGPAGLMLSSAKDTLASYHPIQLGSVPSFIQVTQPIWLNSETLATPMAQNTWRSWQSFFEEIEKIPKTEPNNLQEKCGILTTESDVRFLDAIHQKLAKG